MLVNMNMLMWLNIYRQLFELDMYKYNSYK